MENGQAIGEFGTFLESGNHTTEMTNKNFTLAPNGKTDFWTDESWNFFGQISVSYEHRKEQWTGACVSRIWNF